LVVLQGSLVLTRALIVCTDAAESLCFHCLGEFPCGCCQLQTLLVEFDCLVVVVDFRMAQGQRGGDGNLVDLLLEEGARSLGLLKVIHFCVVLEFEEFATDECEVGQGIEARTFFEFAVVLLQFLESSLAVEVADRSLDFFQSFSGATCLVGCTA
jgi:hypothetical protein